MNPPYLKMKSVPKQFDYDEFTSRNYMYIFSELQSIIRNTSIAFLGTGLCSGIAEQCERLGFVSLYLHDGDTVSLSNLNRQSFEFVDIGNNKVSILKSGIRVF